LGAVILPDRKARAPAIDYAARGSGKTAHADCDPHGGRRLQGRMRGCRGP